ncbi:hypothetical protein P692DRAFT_20871094 [Suillus brevipes Sb2]|nr:hypothetical protein P692DRAFT_20871094 [Suillus brevipes Sb2]
MPEIVPCTQVAQRDFSAFQVPCASVGCKRFFKTTAGRTKHILSAHPIVSPPASPEPHISHPDDITNNPFQDDELQGQPNGDDDEALRASPPPNVHTEFFGPGNLLFCNYHTLLDGQPCDKHGHFLPDGTPPPPPEPKSPNDWTPFRNRAEFETAEFFYIKNQMPAGQIDHLLDLWATTLLKSGGSPPFADHKDLYVIIDSIALGNMKWEGFLCTYTGEKPDGYPPWMDGTYDDIIAGDPETIGSTFVPIILRSDKTTVSVATGNNEYYPLYLSIGNIHNNVRHAHRDVLVVIGFLAMPKTTKKHADDPKFRKFHCQLFHSSLSRILASLRPRMSKPEIAKFGDGHVQHVIYGLGPYIADYKEQVLLACITNSLLDVSLIVIISMLPQSFGPASYLVHQNTITERTLDEIQDAVSRFHQYCEVFKTSGVIPMFSLPQQHSLMHYAHFIRLFGAPNGLCSSITESKHIKAMKKPWRRSSKYKALGQMLVTNQHLSKLAAVHVDFESRGMLKGTCLSAKLEALGMSDNPDVPNDEDLNEPPPNQASNLEDGDDLMIDHGLTILQAHTRLARTVQTQCARNVLALTDELHLSSLPA